MLYSKKASQMNDIPFKTAKEEKDIVAFFIHHNFNKSSSSLSHCEKVC